MSSTNLNPLLEARERLAQAEGNAIRFGKAARKHRRKLMRRKVEHIALTTFEKYLPRLFHSPPHTGQFEQLWSHFIEGLGLVCDNEARFREAHQVILMLLHLGNTRQCWSLPLPDLAIEVKRIPQRQTEEWFSRSGEALKAHQYWLQQVDDGDTGRDSVRLLADILHSAAMHSGLNTAAGLYQLAHAVNRRDPLWHNGQLVWLALSSDDPQVPTNTSGVSGLHSEWRFIPTLPTLGLLYRWYRGNHQCQLPDNQPGFTLWFRPQLYPPLTSLTQLADYGSIIAECLPGVAWPQILVRVANGSQPSVSLPHASWTALHEVALPSPAKLCQVPLKPMATAKRPVLPSSPRSNTRAHSRFLHRLRKAIAEKRCATAKMTSLACRKALQGIDQSELSLPEQILLNWLHHGLKKLDHEPSTLRTYLGNGGVQWLTRCHGHDIVQWSGDTWLAHYQSLLEEYRNPAIEKTPLTDEPGASRHASFVAARLKHLHEFAVQHYGLAPLSESLLEGVRQRPHVRAGFISEPLFNTLLQALLVHPGLSDTLREKLIIITIIAGRAGLRISELIKLRVQDIDDHPDCWLRIRNTPLDDGKSASARRNIPLGCLLPAAEAQRVQHYVHQMHTRTRNIKQALLFPSEAGWRIPLNQQEITSPIVALLHASSDQPLVFHHLRHSAFCKLQMAIHHEELGLQDKPDLIWRNVLPWGRAQCQQIVQTLTRGDVPSRYDVLAQFAGHLGPDTTLRSYLHFCDWVSATTLQQAQFAWTPAQRRYFTGLSDQQLCTSGLDQAPLTYSRCLLLMQHKLRRHLHQQTITQCEVRPLPAPAKRKVDFFVILDFLRLVEQGKNQQGLLASYDIKPALLKEWIARAEALGKLQTQRKYSRHLAHDRKRALLPGNQRSHSEQQELSQLVKKANQLYRSNRAEFVAWLKYLLTHTTISKPGIVFRDPVQLAAFITTTLKLLPTTRLVLRLDCRSSDKKRWVNGFAKSDIEIIYKAINPATRTRNHAILQVRHPDEQSIVAKNQRGTNPSYQHYSTPVLRLLAYVISVQRLEVKEILQWTESPYPR